MIDDDFRKGARAMWSSGDWDDFSRRLAPVGQVVLDRIGIESGARLLDVGTGSGGTIAIPAAQRGAVVVGADVTPELLEHAGRHAQEAGVAVEWVEADARELPFAEETFDRVTSTFGAMFAPDHALATAELVRVCRPGGRIAMTTWTLDGFAGAMFTMNEAFLPTPPPGVQTPSQWGEEEHIVEMFGAAGVAPTITREEVGFTFASVEAAVTAYSEDLGPFVMARKLLEPAGRWEDFIGGFADLIRRFNAADDGSVEVISEYFLILVDR